jgi:hypothetical protein
VIQGEGAAVGRAEGDGGERRGRTAEGHGSAREGVGVVVVVVVRQEKGQHHTQT